MHQIGSIRWSNDRREQQGTPRENVGVSQNRKLWLLVPTLVVHIDKTPTTLFAALGTDNPIAISKKTTQRSFFCIFVTCFSAALLFRNWFGGRQSLLFVKVS